MLRRLRDLPAWVFESALVLLILAAVAGFIWGLLEQDAPAHKITLQGVMKAPEVSNPHLTPGNRVAPLANAKYLVLYTTTPHLQASLNQDTLRNYTLVVCFGEMHTTCILRKQEPPRPNFQHHLEDEHKDEQ